ncbi:methylenetetrahydrofolate reductase [Tropicimonas marinistellae]|uniref:methylenetetrahydrofolate reductase n=1 Tax=Tropicimonas marinistellae TaxID=1739787 RepID=UPI000830BD23|nr:methylenetetrahydrofolate reductase [Tropicimonas marinistellae]
MTPEITSSAPTRGRLEAVLRSGRFAITAELNPPDSANPDDVFEAARPLGEVADAINATDASGANCHMSSLGISALLVRAGYGPVLQISCRDRNRIAVQGDVLGAAALGVRNVLCLTGDDVSAGDQPGAKPVFDFDSVSLVRTLRTMRDEGMFLSGRKISDPPKLFIGAAENPCVEPLEWRPERLKKKIEAGADFIQTNLIFDMDRFRTFMARVREMGLHERAFILAGIGPLTSARVARWMRSRVPGIHIPDALVERLDAASDPAALGQRLCIEAIQEVREIEGVSGVHIMAYRREHLVSEIILQSGVLDRRRILKG